MNNLLPEAEYEQLPTEQADHHFRLKAWIALACGTVAFWTFVVGGVVMLLAGGGE